ncbi:hemolysin family protein [Actibacterium sp. 188UL27-1]|uniref:hemolysin family protein n=1 Tax=Actibacterium sp. 188UL27-1 TaxID=2786961 RepID=UPI00195CD7BA|nr:hemolysin family protein [Actibacterium sp. 188UL27-1]MBM7067357.1 HlyC/CorC family transporter [Actibacterium sp. 188UL27-1]
MGDTPDGSSNAAQRAPDIDHAPDKKGLFGRLLSAFGPQQDPEYVEQTVVSANGSSVDIMPIGIGNLRSMRVEDVAIPKVEIVAIPSDIDQNSLIQVFRDSGLTRLPVYDGTLDSPQGMVHLKDLALRHGFDCNETPFELKPMVRPLLYAPPSMPIGVLLQKMQTERMHMALVIDEYGGVDGLVTIEDLIEQVIGEIEDEHDPAEGSTWSEEKPGCYQALARTPLDEFEQVIGFRLADPEDQEEIDTLGGLVFMLTGRVPARGEVVPHATGAEFEVVDADPRRIKRLRVRLPSAKAAE